MLYAPTFSPATRARLVALLVNALSFSPTLPFHVVTVRFTNPVNDAAIGRLGLSAPYVLFWFATVAVRPAWPIVNVGAPVNVGAL